MLIQYLLNLGMLGGEAPQPPSGMMWRAEESMVFSYRKSAWQSRMNGSQSWQRHLNASAEMEQAAT